MSKLRPYLKPAGMALAGLVTMILVAAGVSPSQYLVERSITIDAPAPVVFAQIANFAVWDRWSPWAATDPSQTTTLSGTPATVGHRMAWKGDRTGEGAMTLTAVDPNRRLDIGMNFVSPMTGTARSAFELQSNPGANGLTLTWSLVGEHDYMGKLFTLFMDIEGAIGTNYEKGLANIKTLAQTQAQQMADLR